MRFALAVVLFAACSSSASHELDVKTISGSGSGSGSGSAAAPAHHGNPFETFTTDSPHAGEHAPDFTLLDADGHSVSLATAAAHGPVVLVWGSFS